MKSTLSDRVSGRVSFDSHSGPAHYLTDAEELVSFPCGAARMGYARTKRDVFAIVEEVVTRFKGQGGSCVSWMVGWLSQNTPMPGTKSKLPC